MDQRPPTALRPEAVRTVLRAERHTLAAESHRAAAGALFLPVPDTSDFVRAARTHRVAGLLARHAHELALPDHVTEALHRIELRETQAALKLASETARAFDAVTSAGVPCLVMKGVPLSVMTTGSPTARGRGDVDLLVARDDVPAAHRALAEAGWRPRFDEAPGRGTPWRLFSWVDRELALDGPDSSVDLHWRIDYDSQLFDPPEVLLTRSVPIDVGGNRIRTLAPSDALAVCCLNVYMDRCSQLRGIVDVVLLTRLEQAGLDLDAPDPQRRLVRDVVQFAEQLVGGGGADFLTQLASEGPADTAYLHALWSTESTKALHSKTERVSMHWLAAKYRHMTGYRQPVVREARWLGKGLISSAVLRPGGGVQSVTRTARKRARQVVLRQPMHP